jgi:diadenosine tetraphosphate (Ap4A) HIT family hydrolase
LAGTFRSRGAQCDFCDEFSGGTANEFAIRYRPTRKRQLLNSAGFRVLPSLGQLVEGHLLILPVQHYRALADLPQIQIARLNDLIRHVRRMLQGFHDECVFFEHGIRGCTSGGCGIDHAHLHAVPVRAEGVLQILIQDFGGTSIDSYADIGHDLAPESSYLFFEDASKSRYVFPVDDLPSQYMRKLVAHSIGKTDWDWRASQYEQKLISTIARLSPPLSQPTAPRG